MCIVNIRTLGYVVAKPFVTTLLITRYFLNADVAGVKHVVKHVAYRASSMIT